MSTTYYLDLYPPGAAAPLTAEQVAAVYREGSYPPLLGEDYNACRRIHVRARRLTGRARIKAAKQMRAYFVRWGHPLAALPRTFRDAASRGGAIFDYTDAREADGDASWRKVMTALRPIWGATTAPLSPSTISLILKGYRRLRGLLIPSLKRRYMPVRTLERALYRHIGWILRVAFD